MPEVVCLSLGWRDISDESEQPVVVELGHSFEGCQLHRFARWPGSAVNRLGLVQPADGLGQRVVVAVTLAAHRGLDAGLRQALCVARMETYCDPRSE
jgi:hypothetical protein